VVPVRGAPLALAALSYFSLVHDSLGQRLHRHVLTGWESGEAWSGVGMVVLKTRVSEGFCLDLSAGDVVTRRYDVRLANESSSAGSCCGWLRLMTWICITKVAGGLGAKTLPLMEGSVGFWL
jgi:hypothetical protein